MTNRVAAMTKLSRNTKRRAKSKDSAPAVAKAPKKPSTGNVKAIDDKIIMACIKYTSAMAAARGAADGDPDGNGKYATDYSETLRTEAKMALRDASAEAKTWQGMAAKARAMLAVIKDMEGIVEEEEEAFLTSVAQDMKRMAGEICNEEWVAELHAKRDAERELAKASE